MQVWYAKELRWDWILQLPETRQMKRQFFMLRNMLTELLQDVDIEGLRSNPRTHWPMSAFRSLYHTNSQTQNIWKSRISNFRFASAMVEVRFPPRLHLPGLHIHTNLNFFRKINCFEGNKPEYTAWEGFENELIFVLLTLFSCQLSNTFTKQLQKNCIRETLQDVCGQEVPHGSQTLKSSVCLDTKVRIVYLGVPRLSHTIAAVCCSWTTENILFEPKKN